jgi:hypothetical protein
MKRILLFVVIDRSAGENAAQVVHGWPSGVKHALIVITAVDGRKEVYRQLTTRLHNDIRMPDGSHGKQFILKAAFLKHVDDKPRVSKHVRVCKFIFTFAHSHIFLRVHAQNPAGFGTFF